MPTYEYHCDACEHEFDEFQSIKDEPLKECPKCRQPRLRRVFGPGAAILFKGSGFYQTDYRSESYKQAAKKEQEKSGANGTAGSNGTAGTNGPAAPAGGKSGETKTAKPGG
jgi:putative FmdB family regulatory protein